MIDIHVHLLPGLDDGPPTIDESLAMARVASSDGLKCVVATPHGGPRGVEVSQKIVEDSVEDLRAALASEGIALSVLAGIEILINPAVAQQMGIGQAFTLNRSRYALVELPPLLYPRYTEEVLFQLQVKGYTPVLAHPERYTTLQNDVGILYRMVERGIMAQVTAGSIVGDFGRRVQQTAQLMLEHNLVHVIASDAHSAEGRPPILSRAVECAARIVGAEQALAMVTAVPEAIIGDGVPRLLPPVPIKKKGWALWR